VLQCGQYLSVDSPQIGVSTYEIILGTDIGTVNFSVNAYTVPDRFQIYWDGNLIADTGFLGSSQYDAQLISLGYPPTVGYSATTVPFQKTTAQPTTATLVVTSPIDGSVWGSFLECVPVTPEECSVLISADLQFITPTTGKVWFYNIITNSFNL
jgi:hypothetical protein